MIYEAIKRKKMISSFKSLKGSDYLHKLIGQSLMAIMTVWINSKMYKSVAEQTQKLLYILTALVAPSCPFQVAQNFTAH